MGQVHGALSPPVRIGEGFLVEGRRLLASDIRGDPERHRRTGDDAGREVEPATLGNPNPVLEPGRSVAVENASAEQLADLGTGPGPRFGVNSVPGHERCGEDVEGSRLVRPDREPEPLPRDRGLRRALQRDPVGVNQPVGNRR